MVLHQPRQRPRTDSDRVCKRRNDHERQTSILRSICPTSSHANKRDCFALCLDEQCRNEFLGKMKSAVSTLSEIMFPQQGSSVKIPNLVSKNEKPNVTFVQRYIKSPFALSKIYDGQDRADLAMLCKNDPRNLQRLLQGAEGGRRRQQLFLKFFNHRGWVPIAEHREDQAAFLPGRS